MRSASGQKRERERVRLERAAIKRARRQGGTEAGDDPASGPDGAPRVVRPQTEVLSDLSALHERFEAERITLEDFESAKADLLAELDVG
jgi:hypothetical protein